MTVVQRAHRRHQRHRAPNRAAECRARALQLGQGAGQLHACNLAIRPAWRNMPASEAHAVNEHIAARYRRFAELEAHGRSPLYEAFALGVAAIRSRSGFLAALPEDQRQPNLLFAALRHMCGTPRDWPAFRALLRDTRGGGARDDAGAPHADQ